MADEIVRVGTDSAGAPRSRSALVVAGVVLVAIAGLVVRLFLLNSPAAVINADEAYTRIDTFEILRGQFPIALGGTVYTFPLESYLYTPFTYVFGANVIPLKLLSTLSWVLTSVVLYFVGTRLMSTSSRTDRRGDVLDHAWRAARAVHHRLPGLRVGNAGVARSAFLLASIVVDAPSPNRRTMVLFGVLAGFGFWMHPMFLATLVPMVAFVLWTVRRRLDGWISVIGGGILGCLPLLLWNAVNSFPSIETPVKVPGTYTERLRTFAMDLLPRAFGLRDSGLNWYDDGLGPIVYVALVGTSRRSGSPRSCGAPPRAADTSCSWSSSACSR